MKNTVKVLHHIKWSSRYKETSMNANPICSIRFLVVVTAAWLMITTPPVAVFADEPLADTSTRTDVEKVLADYEAARQEYEQVRGDAKPEAREALRQRLLPPVENGVKHVRWAAQNPDDKSALPMLRLVMEFGPDTKAAEYAATVLTDNHLAIDGEEFRQVGTVLMSMSPVVSLRCLQTYMDKSPKFETRGTACFGLGLYKAQLVSWSQLLNTDLRLTIPPPALSYVAELDQRETLAEAEGLLQRTKMEFAEVELRSGEQSARLGDLAESVFGQIERELKTLVIGASAPDIDRVDIAGVRRRLADYRGKVVVLVFWSTTCAPCMKAIPQERELVKRYRDKPFALLAVNMDEDKDRAMKAIADHDITWPNWWDAETDTSISSTWSVSLLPTVYVIDQEGVIRFKHVRDQRLTEAVDGLLAKTDAKVQSGEE